MPSACHDELRAAKWPARLGPGSEGGFEREVLPHVPVLRWFATRFVHARADVEDLVQETMLRACRKWEQYEPGTNVRAWLMTIMRNYYINVYRTARREPLVVEFEEATLRGEAFPEAVAGTGSPSQALTDETVIRAIDTLPAKYREALLLSDVDGLPIARIAELLDVPVGTVKSRVHRARRQARVRLRDHAVELGVVSADQGETSCSVPRRRIA